ncbi:MAG: hypothetical protein PHF18_15495 [Methanosarcina sp.]|uniref:hypothetical protein n=1 Tax=Methanosarcina sp. TaxID=2213 RepID=UPI00260DC58F|nr:hypothetical protein [Methanosarcina sp.]MDD3248232.1 hypothetical protein [Methanosarcina sp.]
MASHNPTDKDIKKNTEKCKKLCELTDKDIERLLEKRLSFTGKGNDRYSRYSAYDYCYNHFRDFHENFLKREKREILTHEMNILCLQLGLFLGTWGMFRNSDLQKCSFRIYEPLIKKIFEEEDLWKIDVKDYCVKKDEINSETWKAICCFKKEIQMSLGQHGVLVTDTLATKIMMVVFGCVPAYDSYFSSTLEPVPKLDQKSLKYIYKFYHKKKDCLDKKQKELKTVKVDGGLTDCTYTIAKIIDIIGFREKEETDIKNQKNTKGKDKSIWEEKKDRKKEKEKKLKQRLEKLEPELKKDC